ncbi:MAG: CRISPR-associated helicase Cas3' [Caldilineaceae bacterium]|nr:CRISPR-associated helicase Cas3' [Caldilineaceae bacterium]
MIHQSLAPTHTEHLKAKSADVNGYRQTLTEHTWAVLCRLADQYRLRPLLSEILNKDGIWSQMYYACLLHDFGKAAQGFQERLEAKPPENDWSKGKHRHEVLSLAFVDWLFPPNHPDRLPVICAIVSHHKDVEQIWAKYGAPGRTREQRRRVEWLITQISPDIEQVLWRWLDEYAEPWREALGLPALFNAPSPQYISISADAVFRALDECSDYLLRYEDVVPDLANLVEDVQLRGLILTADHAASAGTGRFPDMSLTRAVALRPLKGLKPRDHQADAEKGPAGSALMIAPTGSGKTEAALLWAAHQHQLRPAARLFYTLPYQASMNAMYTRLLSRFFGYDAAAIQRGDCEEVTIQHSRALLKFYQALMEVDESSPTEARRMAKWLRNRAQLNYHPIQVFSPYQMLKAAYSLKGYETLLVDYTDALFIFDEIHAYEPKRLALIITLMGWLAECFHARFLVMTATLPPPVQAKLQVALGVADADIIHASAEEFIRSRRHTVHLLEGRLEEKILEVARADWAAGRTVLICLNRVSDAQRIYKLLKCEMGLIPEEEIVLLHSRFNGEDRSRKEAILLERAGVGRRHPDSPSFITVATQVVEVSLDVDFDTLYTDPAPLEALLQRFGRVNRGRSAPAGETVPLCPVHVFRVPNSTGKRDPFMPYVEGMVTHSLEVLEAYCGGGRAVDESLVTAMLKEIYQGEIAAAWEAEYEKSAQEFREVILDGMKPFFSAPANFEERFYKMFEGIEVLPVDRVNEYQDALEERGYLDASRYLVNISMRQYGEFNGYGRIVHARAQGEYVDHIDAPYNAEFGLDLEAARQEEKARKAAEAEDGF